MQPGGERLARGDTRALVHLRLQPFRSSRKQYLPALEAAQFLGAVSSKR
jgi:hypothetical protein